MFIVLEGIDGCGKSTQAKLLKEYFLARSEQVLLTFEPGNTDAGKMIRQMILTDTSLQLHPRTELLLFNADRVEHVEKVIRPALSAGKVVISDRYIYSTIAYQVAGRGFSDQIINTFNNFTTAKVLPDHVFYIDLDPQTALGRIKQKDKFENEEIEFYQRVQTKYRQLALKFDNFHQIDGTGNISQIHQEIITHL